MLDIANQLLTRHSPFANFFGLWLLNTETSYRQSCSEFSGKGGKNQNTERKTESLLFSGFDNGTSHGYERKSTTKRLATGRIWPCTWKISSDGEDQVSKWEFCVFKKITPIVCFLVFQSIFSSWASAPTHFTIFIQRLLILHFDSLINK